MRIVVFGEDQRVGAWVDDTIVDLAAADPTLPATLAGLIAQGARALDLVQRVIEAARAGSLEHAVAPLEPTLLHAPAVYRPRIGCAAGNYAAHTAGTARRKGVESTAALIGVARGGLELSVEEIAEATRARRRPRGFWKDFAWPAGPEDTIEYPARCERFDYEGEVVAVLGSTAKDVPPGQGGSYVWGVTLLNDWSIRGPSTKDSLSFNLGKNFDGAASVGPCIVVGDLDPAAMLVETRVNGELRQSYNSGDMIFSHAEYVEYLSRDLTLRPGDMISGGSGPGSATDTGGSFLQPGDVVEVSSPGVGVLRNTVVSKGGDSLAAGHSPNGALP
jgi:2-keto-4-pentenoate hydratase/2-oxohepta-3-ene-1,7-dioic acid hydratase in catechol pathway